jgi:hypothetical protein
MSQTVAVFQTPLNDHGYDLHVSVTVHTETSARINNVIVYYAQSAKAHGLRIVIFAE